jgi:hypothetical protein
VAPAPGRHRGHGVQRLPEQAWAGLAAEAASLLALLADREPRIYRRYARWWAGLPSAEVRVLPG